MPRPSIVRADTHDLQSHDAPAAQDHSNTRGGLLHGVNGFGASQSQAIRNVAEEQLHSQYSSGAHGHHNNHQQMGQHDEDELDRELADAETAGDSGSFDEDLMDKMSSSPSIADEDIDFDMVYALHHFNATVEGQANAAKGEHMVLLDDSNSYWWLVRIVRDSSIGYLPAEHIETPTERLARLNKHRNIDLAANMLSDSVHERTKNPLKKAMRRRNAKTVTFTSPTYHEASEYEYSSEEEEEGQDGASFDEDEEETAELQNSSEDQKKLKSVTSTPLKPTGRNSDNPMKAAVSVVNSPANDPRTSHDITKSSSDTTKPRLNPPTSALRHPDSALFHDENQGTKKLTLTPNLLRDDSNTGIPLKPEVIKGRASLDRDKQQQQPKREDGVTSPPLNSRDGRKPRKGGSVLGSLFKKRSKKGRRDEEDEIDEWLQHGTEKNSIDSNRSIDSVTVAGVNRGDESKKEKEEAQLRDDQRMQQEIQRQQQLQQQIKAERELREQKESEAEKRKPKLTTPQAPPRSEPETKEELPSNAPKARQPEPVQASQPALGQGVRSPIASRQLSNGSLRTERMEQSGRASPIATRNDSRSPQLQSGKVPASEPSNPPQFHQPNLHTHQSQRSLERLSESPEQITFHDASERPNLSVDTSSGVESNDASSSIDSSPELIDRSSTFDSVTSPVPISTPAFERTHAMQRTWSDWSLKTYFEDDNDVRDMLIVVQQDKGDVVQEMQHSEITPLFEDSTKRLADITQQLDGMLGDWLHQRRRS